jgi:hypothetical protein
MIEGLFEFLCGCLLTFLRFIVREVEEASPIKTRKADYSSLLVFPSSLRARKVGSYPLGLRANEFQEVLGWWNSAGSSGVASISSLGFPLFVYSSCLSWWWVGTLYLSVSWQRTFVPAGAWSRPLLTLNARPMTVESVFPSTLHFATLYFDNRKSKFIFLADEEIYLLKFIKFHEFLL